jgi:hypothetical protein
VAPGRIEPDQSPRSPSEISGVQNTRAMRDTGVATPVTSIHGIPIQAAGASASHSPMSMQKVCHGNHCSFSPAHRFVALFRWREKSRRRRRGDCCWAECSGAARCELISAQGEDANTPSRLGSAAPSHRPCLRTRKAVPLCSGAIRTLCPRTRKGWANWAIDRPCSSSTTPEESG